MLSVFILCAGSGDRWNDHLGIPKQLLTFGAETLIQRAARIIKARIESSLYVVTQDERISLPPCKTLRISKTDSLAETILTTEPFWSEKNIFLLGDVFYTKAALDLILDCDRSLTFFGRPWPSAYVKCGHGEMFGLSFSAIFTQAVYELVVSGLADKSRENANLWALYQLAGGLPVGSSQYIPELLEPVDDYTNDIDTPCDYQRRGWLYQRLSLNGQEDFALRCRKIALWPAHTLGLFRWQLLCVLEALQSQLSEVAIKSRIKILVGTMNPKVRS